MELGSLQTLLLLVVTFSVSLRWWTVTNKRKRLPPGPLGLPIFGNLLQIWRNANVIEALVLAWGRKCGPIFTIWFGHTPFIFVQDRHLTHSLLIKHGNVSADRPKPSGFRKIFTCDGHSINSATYDSLWRTLRGNLVSSALSHSAVASSSAGREWALAELLKNLEHDVIKNTGRVQPRDHLRDLVYRIALRMCFGLRVDDKCLNKVKTAIMVMNASPYSLNDSPLGPLIPCEKKAAMEIRSAVYDAILPLIHTAGAPSYASSLGELRVNEDRRALTEDEIVTLCIEVIVGGTDTTLTALEWCLARLVLDRRVQEALYNEVSEKSIIKEEDVKGMKYLQAVVKETLRRHPPTHFVVTHAAHEDVVVGGYVVPAGSRLNFYVYGMAMDPAVWDRPERFLKERADSDMTGTKEILLMPFGVGRRICPGMGLALMHLSLFIARLVQAFKWDVVPGEGVDLSETAELTVMMRHPLRALLTRRTQLL